MNSTGAPLVDSEVAFELSAFAGVDCVAAVDCELLDSEGCLLPHAEQSAAAKNQRDVNLHVASPFRAEFSVQELPIATRS